jgi:hypothetical protein
MNLCRPECKRNDDSGKGGAVLWEVYQFQVDGEIFRNHHKSFHFYSCPSAQ